MPPSRRTVITIAISLVVAAACARLGFWQLDRLAGRRGHNATLLARLSQPELPLRALSSDTAAGHYRRVTVSGTLRYDREIVWAPRMRRGSPGVNFLTPIEIVGTDTSWLVNRGWAYSPDAKSTEFARWREGDTVTVSGYVETWSQDCGAASALTLAAMCGDTAARLLRRLDRIAAERLVGAAVAPYIVMQTSDSVLRADSVPARVEQPVLDEGPHFNYAMQWFAFSTIALVGGVVLARKRPIR